MIRKRSFSLNLQSNFGLLLFSGFILGSSLWATFVSSGNSTGIVLNMAVFLFLILHYPLNTSEYHYVCLLVAIFGSILAIMIVFNIGISSLVYERSTIVIAGVAIDQNNLAVSLAVPAIYAFHASQKYSRRKIFYLPLFGVMVLAILMSGSRGGLLAFGLGLLAYIFEAKDFSKWKIVLLLIIVLGLTPFAIQLLLPQNLASRFTIESVLSSGGTGRINIWIRAWEIFKISPLLRQLFGYGFGTFAYLQQRFFQIYCAAHNDLIQLLLEVGVIGIALYLLMWFDFVKVTLKKKSPLPIAFLVCVAIGSLSMEMLVKKMLWNAIYLALIYPREKEPLNSLIR